MNVGSAFTAGVLEVVFAILSVIQWLVIIAAVISWLNPDRLAHFGDDDFRKLLPPRRTGGIDFSPLLVILVILFIRTFLSRLFLRPGGLI